MGLSINKQTNIVFGVQTTGWISTKPPGLGGLGGDLDTSEWAEQREASQRAGQQTGLYRAQTTGYHFGKTQKFQTFPILPKNQKEKIIIQI